MRQKIRALTRCKTMSEKMPRLHTVCTVAVVDDDESVLKALDALLQSADYSVLLFTTAAALLRSGCVSTIDCLISDIGLPVIDGFELSRLVGETRPGLPVILITGRPETLLRRPAAPRRAHCIFGKPFDGDEVLAAVAAALALSRAGQPRP
jgi:FixJ family two-component response regulator